MIVTGNTVIDALLATRDRIAADGALVGRPRGALRLPGTGRRVLLVTGHRRENFGSGFEGICDAARPSDTPDIDIVYPVLSIRTSTIPSAAPCRGEATCI